MRSNLFAGISYVCQEIWGFPTQLTDVATLVKLLCVDCAYIWKVGFVLLMACLFTIQSSAGTDHNGCLPGAAWAFCWCYFSVLSYSLHIKVGFPVWFSAF